MKIALRAYVKVLFQLFIVYDLAAVVAFGPKAAGHVFLLRDGNLRVFRFLE